MNGLAYCIAASKSDSDSKFFKTTISGDDISNGPRWWVTSSQRMTIGKQLDKWGDKNGVTTCSGEDDSAPGWINDSLSFFGINVRNSDKGHRNLSLEELGYDCPLNGSSYTCTNDKANDDVNTPGSVLYILRNLPYLNGKNLVNLSSSDKTLMAASYYVAKKDYVDLCGAAVNTGTNNITTIAVVSDDGIITEQKWGGGKSSLDAGSGEVSLIANGSEFAWTPLGFAIIENDCTSIAKYLTKDYASAYLTFTSKGACTTKYSNSSEAAACIDGTKNKTPIDYCTNKYKAGYQGSTFVDNGPQRLACYVGQGNQGAEDCIVTLKYSLDAPTDPSNPGVSNESLLKACIDGTQNTDETYCETTYADGYNGSIFEKKDALRTACKDGQKYPSGAGIVVAITDCPAGSTDPNCEKPADGSTSCVVDGVGWMVCPLMNALGGLNDAMYGWIESVLVLNPLGTTDENGDPTAQYLNWSIIRNIANVLLVIAFLIIIFSQISSIGISNYGVKKMLPRVIIIAVAINLSWTIMSLAVDVVNVAGVGLHTLLDSAAVSPGAETLNSGNATASLVAGLVTGTAAIAVGTAVGLATAGLSTLVLMALPFLLGAALALLAAVATLFLRNALIIVLVIIAPVALVAYLLPNTEEYFKKWRKLFVSMLFLFPMAALLFAGAKFAAYVIVTSEQPLAQITALFVMAAPLGLLPWLARSSGGILSSVNQRMNSMAKGLQSATQRGLATRVEAGKAERRANTRNFLGGRRNPYKETEGLEEERHEKDRYQTINGKRRRVAKKGDIKLDAEGKPIMKAFTVRTPRNRTFGGVISDMSQGLKQRTDTAQKAIGSNYQEAGLRNDGKRRTAKVAAQVDANKLQGLRSEAIDAQYKGRLEVSKLVPGQSQDLYDRLQDAGATTSSLEHEQTLRQKDRLISNAENTAAGSIDLSRLSAATAREGASNTATGQAERLRNLAEGSIDIDGGRGLKVLHENQERAEFATQNIDATLKSEFEKSKLAGGANSDLYAESILGKADSEKTAAIQQKIEADARLGMNTQAEDGRTLFSQELDENGKLVGGALGAIRNLDQDTQAYKAGAAWAEGGKGVEYAAEIDNDTERGRELAAIASGADTNVRNIDGSQKYETNPDGSVKLDANNNPIPKVTKLAQAKAAKVVLEDKEGDQNTIVSLAKSRKMENSEALANIGVDIMKGTPIIDPATGELKGSNLTSAEQLGYIRYAAGRADRQTTMSLLSHVGRMGKAAKEAEKLAAADPNNEDLRQKAQKARQEAKDAQQVLLEAGDSSMPPWMGGSDKQKLAEGNFDYDTAEAALAAAGGGKLTADAFAAMDINNRDTFVEAIKSLDPNATGEAKEKYDFVIRNVAKTLAWDDGVDFNTLTEAEQDAKVQELTPRILRNFAQTIIPIDKAQYDPRLNRNLAARDKKRYDDMRARLQELSGNLTPQIETGEKDANGNPTTKDYEGPKQLDRL
jgi:hypothetical protein